MNDGNYIIFAANGVQEIKSESEQQPEFSRTELLGLQVQVTDQESGSQNRHVSTNTFKAIVNNILTSGIIANGDKISNASLLGELTISEN